MHLPTAALTALTALCFSSVASAAEMTAEMEGDRRYYGFGGVNYGIVHFFDGAKPDKGETEIPLNGQGGNQSIGSEFLLRVDDSNWFLGYAIAIQGGAAFTRQLSVFNTNKTTKSDACYGEQCYGLVETTYVDVLHIPLEANTAYVIDAGRFNFWGSGGPSLHIAKFTAYNSANAVQVLDRKGGDDPSNNTSTSAISELEGRSRKYGVGFQIGTGVGVELGSLPKIGGRWGLTLSGKFQYVQEMKMRLQGKYQFQEYLLDGSECPDNLCPNEKRSWKEDVVIDSTNLSARLGIVFFF